MYDILIRNGTVIDGSGSPMFRADVAVKEEKIAAIGDLRSETAERIIDAEGLYVSPVSSM
jgi:N-acyl-D-amino-acid deacylase